MISGAVKLVQSLSRSPALRTLPRFSAVKLSQARAMSSSKSQFVFPDDQVVIMMMMIIMMMIMMTT